MKRWILMLAALALVAAGPAMADACRPSCGKMGATGCGTMPGCAQMPGCGGTAAWGQLPGCGERGWMEKGRLHSSHEPGNIWYRGPAPGRTLLDCCSPGWGRGACGHPRMVARMRAGGPCGQGPCAGRCAGPCGGRCAGPCGGSCAGPCGGPASMKTGCGPGGGCGPGAALTSAKGPGCGPMAAKRVVVRKACAPKASANAWSAGSWDTGWKKCNSVKRGGACCHS